MEKMVLVPYDKYQRMLEANSVKTVTAPKPKKKEGPNALSTIQETEHRTSPKIRG